MMARNASKRARLAPEPSSGDMSTLVSTQEYDIPSEAPEIDAANTPNRASLACEACRARKTRCVGYPVCTWCQQRRISCVRGHNTQISPLENWGSQILESVSRAKTEIVDALHQTQGTTNDSGTAQREKNVHTIRSHENSQVNSTTASSAHSRHTSADSILRWNVFSEYTPNLLTTHHTARRDVNRQTTSAGTADLSLPALEHLTRYFEQSVLAFYPVIDPKRLQRHVRDVAESGGRWNTETCLVAVVCAVAALCMTSTQISDLANHDGDSSNTIADQDSTSAGNTPFSPWSSAPSRGPSGSSTVHWATASSSTLSSARAYWAMAKRRLGWAIEDHVGLTGVQCFVFAGFWHLQNGTPHDARTMFVRAREMIADSVQTSLVTVEDRFLIPRIRLICALHVYRLSTELELGPVATQTARLHLCDAVLMETSIGTFDHPLERSEPELPTMSTVQQYSSIRMLVDNSAASCELSSSSPSSLSPSLSWRELYALLGRVAETRAQIDSLITANNDDNLAVLELTAVALRICLQQYLSHSLLQRLNQSTDGTATLAAATPRPANTHVLEAVRAIADECLAVTHQYLEALLAAWRLSDQDHPYVRSSSSQHDYWPSPIGHQQQQQQQQQGIETSRQRSNSSMAQCRVDGWLSHRSAYGCCLTLLAVHVAKMRASRGEMQYVHCHGLTMPFGWRQTVRSYTDLVCIAGPESELWAVGQVLGYLLAAV